MQPVQKHIQQFLAVLLFLVVELSLELANYTLQEVRCHRILLIIPQLFDEFGVTDR